MIHNSCQGHFKKAAKLLSKTMTSLQEVRALPNCHFCVASNFDFEVPFEVFFFLDPVNLRMTVMDLCIGQG